MRNVFVALAAFFLALQVHAQRMEVYAQRSIEEEQSILRSTFESWRGNLKQVDDICIIGVRL